MRRTLTFQDHTLQIVEQPIPEIKADEVLIQPLLMGICSTDQELTNGYKDFSGILGHEFVGMVVAGPDEWTNQRVVGEINLSCGECDMCLQQMPTHCRNRRTLGLHGDYDGAFADRFHLPIKNLHVVPDQLSDKEAVFAEPLAAACEILDQIEVRPSDSVVVVGMGKLGMLVAQVLKLTGADISGIVRHTKQAELLEKWGIAARHADELAPNQADIVIECTGNERGFQTAIDLVRARGTIVLKSTYAHTPQINMTQIVVNEIQVVGSRCGPFPKALNLLAENKIDVLSLIEGVYSLDDALTAFEQSNQSGILKVLLRP